MARIRQSVLDLQIVPMLARISRDVPAQNYAYEVKWDGLRALAHIEGGRMRIVSRNLRDITDNYPELNALAQQLKKTPLILDGEIVALDENGLPNFGMLQTRMQVRDVRAVNSLCQSTPVTYMIFDVLHLGGNALFNEPYLSRRSKLQALDLNGQNWKTPEHFTGNPHDFVEATQKLGLEGIIAKECSSFYQPGIRSSAWLKIKHIHRQEFVIGGWLDGQGARDGLPGAFLMGYYDISPREARKLKRPQKFVYAGKVGTGYSQKMLASLLARLKPREVPANPFEIHPPRERKIHFVPPELVAEVQYGAWTHTHMLRHASFLGLRDDKSARDVVREE